MFYQCTVNVRGALQFCYIVSAINLYQVSIFCFSIFMIFIRIVESVYHYAAVFCCSSFGCTQQVTFTTLFSAFVLHLLSFDDQHFSFFQIFQIGFPYPFVIKLLSADINIRTAFRCY